MTEFTVSWSERVQNKEPVTENKTDNLLPPAQINKPADTGNQFISNISHLVNQHLVIFMKNLFMEWYVSYNNNNKHIEGFKLK